MEYKQRRIGIYLEKLAVNAMRCNPRKPVFLYIEILERLVKQHGMRALKFESL